MSESSQAPSTAVLAVDTGGTFTDVLLLVEGRLQARKVPSTPHDPAEAVLEGIRGLLGDRGGFLLVHGSTVATNALLERKGARVALVTNRGFEDVLEIGRQNRPRLYALSGHRAAALVTRQDRIGIAGRLGAVGEELEPLEPDELASLPERLAGAESAAVCLLHSYADPAHEAKVAEALASSGIPVSVSSALLPEFREYERASTTVVNAYVAPLIGRYLGRLDRESRARRIRIMGSGGGSLPVERAAREPVQMVLSGPAGGVVGAVEWGRRSGFRGVLSFDMGGTSTDVSLCPGAPVTTREFEIAGHPVAVPVLDIHTVGAGGGSLARIDPGGALRVGPESAGAEPGPICYGRGGRSLTVTDAHVWLGRLPPDAFLGGARALHRDAVEGPLRELARRLGRSPEEAAAGILAVADTAMERALRVISVERGHDPADFVLVAFGGAGGLHAAELSSRVGAARALVPPDPGLLSAYGMLAAPVTREASRTVLLSSADQETPHRLAAELLQLEQAAVRLMVEEGSDPADVRVERSIDARYRGQSFELRIPAADWEARFHAAHRTRYGYERLATPAEAVTLRVVAGTPGQPIAPGTLPEAEGPPRAVAARVWMDGAWRDARRVARRDLASGHRLAGPLVVTEYSGTTWVPDGWTLEVDRWGSLHLLPQP